MRNLTKIAIFHPKKGVKKSDESDQNCHQRTSKEGAVTVLSKSHYRTKSYEHLSNQNAYQKLDKNLNPNIMNFFLNTTQTQKKNFFTDKELQYLNESPDL